MDGVKKRLAFGLENNHLIDRVDIEVAEILDLMKAYTEAKVVKGKIDIVKRMESDWSGEWTGKGGMAITNFVQNNLQSYFDTLIDELTEKGGL